MRITTPFSHRVAATLLGLSPGTLKKMRSRKQGPHYFQTETGAIRYLLPEVLAYRARQIGVRPPVGE